ncbi:MAG: hypothetical protein HY746_06025 [Elusimicrobia bacterium]|nr:hypothetical protein [Elusimicrobiota bacterium]
MRISSSYGRLFYVAMALMYCLLYEWVNIFNIPGVTTYVNILKFALPFLLFLGLSSYLFPNFSLPKKYLLYFALFMVWGLVPNVLSGHIPETMMQWMKFILRFFFCYVIFAYLLQRPEAKTVIMKALVAIALGNVLQYMILSMYYVPGDPSGFPLPISQPTTYYGPYGLMGDGNAYLSFENFNLRIFRLTGFWFEPSSISGFLFMAFFLAKALFEQTQQRRWKLSGLVCLGGGLLTFSNAGYLAFGCALLSGYIVRFKEKRKNYLCNIVKVIILLVFIFLTVFGRAIIAEYYPDNMVLRNLSGVRDSVEDPYSGRIEQLQCNLEIVLEHPEGIGFRIMGIDAEGRGVAYAGAAPFVWLVCTGWIGLFLILMRDAQVLRAMRKRPLSSNSISIFQAWAVLFFQNFTFGTWMTPLYFLLVAMVFTATYYRNDTGTIMKGSPV